MMIEQMVAVAWSKMGLQPDMLTGKMDKDLDQAKAAIDIAAYLSSIVEPKLDESDQRQMHSLMRDLKMNYVNKRREETGGE